MLNNRKIKILAIDDKEDNLITLNALLKEFFQNVDYFSTLSGMEGIELAKRERPDVILLDIIMPDLNGFEVCKQLKSDDELAGIPVVFLTALRNEKETRIEALKVGAEGFLSKPVDEAELIAQIKAMVRIKEANDQKKTETERLNVLVKQQTVSIQKELDIRKKTEQKFRIASENWRKTFDAINDCIALLDRNNLVIECNKAFIALVGQPKLDIIGKPCFSLVHNADHPIKVCPFLRSYKSKAREFNEMMRNDRLFEVVVDPILNEENEIISFVHILSDITHKKETETIQKIQYDVASAVMNESNLETLMYKIRHDFEKIMPHTTLYVVLNNEGDQDLRWIGEQKNLHHKVDQALLEVINHVISWEKPYLLGSQLPDTSNKPEYQEQNPFYEVYGVPVVLCKKNTGVLAGVSQNQNIRFDNTNTSLMKNIAQEVSLYLERLQSQKDLIKAKEHAEENDRLKTAFLANMSHEIRTPMNGVLGFTDILKDPSLTHEKRETIINLIEKSGHRLFNLINDLIDISIIESRQVSLNYSPIDVKMECETLAAIFQREAIEKKLMISFLPPEKPVGLEFITDKNKMVSILSNLLKNAIKFTEQGEITFGYTLDEGMIRFFVKDTGIGIPPEKQKAVFDRFVQADNRISRGYEGVGLGLSIAKAYVDILGGEISLLSEVDKGSEFFVTLPLKQPYV